MLLQLLELLPQFLTLLLLLLPRSSELLLEVLVRFREGVEVDTKGFYASLLADHGTYVGPGHWFEVDDRHFRLGFGWPTESELHAGLTALTAAGAGALTSQ